MIEQVFLPQVSSQKISNQVYDLLREKIISKEFAPGQRLNLNAIEEQLGISRTPLKEALARLEMEGLVEITRGYGTFVTNPGPEAIAESFATRLAIESYAAEIVAEQASDAEIESLAAMVRQLGALVAASDRLAIYPQYLELDHEFHTMLVGLVRNRRLSAVHQRENVHAQMARIRYHGTELELDETQREHEVLMAALADRDGARARQVLRAHMTRGARWVLDNMEVSVSG